MLGVANCHLVHFLVIINTGQQLKHGGIAGHQRQEGGLVQGQVERFDAQLLKAAQLHWLCCRGDDVFNAVQGTGQLAGEVASFRVAVGVDEGVGLVQVGACLWVFTVGGGLQRLETLALRCLDARRIGVDDKHLFQVAAQLLGDL